MDPEELLALAKTKKGQAVSRIVTLENLAEHEPLLRTLLPRYGLHPRQIELILRRNRELMQAGYSHAEALALAVAEAGDPGGKRLYVNE